MTTSEKECIFSEDEIKTIVSKFDTPFHLYDERTIRQRCQNFYSAFSWVPQFKNYFAVKACPNPHILKIVKDMGLGADCSSLAELYLAESVGLKQRDIMFTSNNTPLIEYKKAKELGAIINLDDMSHIDFLHETLGLPDLLCFRYNPGALRHGNEIIGDPESAKFGVTKEQLITCFHKAKSYGVKQFGLHTMIVSNCLDISELVETARMIFELVVLLYTKHDIKLEFVNLGGGIGIPYKPTDCEVDIQELSFKVQNLYQEMIENIADLKGLNVVYECGRYITGPAGVLVTKIIHQKDIYKRYIGVDTCINSLMRPALYNAYHHITVIQDENNKNQNILPKKKNLFTQDESSTTLVTFDIVGSLCENNDKLAIDRLLPISTKIGDYLIFHDTGAHGHCMGFNYNGKLRCAEYLKHPKDYRMCLFSKRSYLKLSSGEIVAQIRHAETLKDLFSTIIWKGTLPGKKFMIDCCCVKPAAYVLLGITAGIIIVKTFCCKMNKVKQ